MALNCQQTLVIAECANVAKHMAASASAETIMLVAAGRIGALAAFFEGAGVTHGWAITLCASARSGGASLAAAGECVTAQQEAGERHENNELCFHGTVSLLTSH